jgi:tryptophan-rich sensory protein
MDWIALALAVGLCGAMAGAEGMLSGRDLPAWLNSLKRPRAFAPIWVWAIAAALTYLLQGAIAYRLLAPPRSQLDIAALAALFCVMSANIAYNVVLDRTRDPAWTYRGLIWFLPALAVLQILLLLADPISGWMHLAYVAWVVGYDLPVMRAVARLNPPGS